MTADLTGAPTCDDRLGSKDETASQELVQSALRSSVAENLKGTWWLPAASCVPPLSPGLDVLDVKLDVKLDATLDAPRRILDAHTVTP